MLTKPKTITVVWMLLTGLTLSSAWLSEPRGTTLHVNAAVTLSVLLMALIKCRLIMQHFMEVRRSPRRLRLFSDLWLTVFFVGVALIYLY